jgi:ribosome-associated protein
VPSPDARHRHTDRFDADDAHAADDAASFASSADAFDAAAIDRADDDHGGDGDDAPSKSQRKREMLALQALGEKLVALPAERFKHVDLPETLREAVVEARRLTKHGALRRQLQYVGRVMRHVDAAPIRAQIDALEGVTRDAAHRLHRIERWRERLLAEPEALTDFVAQYPDADVQALRTLVRNAQRERDANRPPRAFRELFQQLRALLDTPADREIVPSSRTDPPDPDIDFEEPTPPTAPDRLR